MMFAWVRDVIDEGAERRRARKRIRRRLAAIEQAARIRYCEVCTWPLPAHGLCVSRVCYSRTHTASTAPDGPQPADRTGAGESGGILVRRGAAPGPDDGLCRRAHDDQYHEDAERGKAARLASPDAPGLREVA